MEKLSLKDLRIGNFVKWKDNDSIFELTLDLFCDKAFQRHIENGDIIGISLTSEILLACGFEYKDANFIKYGIKLFPIRNLYYRANFPIKADIRHLQQLQNLYYFLCNQELEFKPELK